MTHYMWEGGNFRWVLNALQLCGNYSLSFNLTDGLHDTSTANIFEKPFIVFV